MILWQTAGAFAAVFALSVFLGVPRKFIHYAGAVGAFGWFVYLLCGELTSGILLQNFVAAIMVALVSHSFARIFKAPVTVFLIAGITPLVPGTGMYRTVYQLFQSNGELAGFYFNQTIQIAGVIALAIFIMDTIFRIHRFSFYRKDGTVLEESEEDFESDREDVSAGQSDSAVVGESGSREADSALEDEADHKDS